MRTIVSLSCRRQFPVSHSFSGVRCLVLQSSSWLLSGGADGYVIKWDVSSGDLGPALQVGRWLEGG